jgi:hypothetical protein
VTHVQWHGRGWGYGRATARARATGEGYGRGGWGGAWPFIGFGAAVIAGAIIADQAYRPHSGHYYDEGPYDGPYHYPAGFRGDPREICLQNYRTFEWRTGLYTTYSGQKRLCPYLRDVGRRRTGHRPRRHLIGRLIELSQLGAVRLDVRLPGRVVAGSALDQIRLVRMAEQDESRPVATAPV